MDLNPTSFTSPQPRAISLSQERNPELLKQLITQFKSQANASNANLCNDAALVALRRRNWGQFKGIDKNVFSRITDFVRSTLIMQLAIEDDEVLVNVLSWNIPGYSNYSDSKRNTALHFAAQYGSVNTIRILSKKIPIDITNADGETPLLLAIRFGQTDCVKALLEEGASFDCYYQVQKFNISIELNCLALAIELRNVACIDLLLRDYFSSSLLEMDGATILHVVVFLKAHEMISYLFEKYAHLIFPLIEKKSQKQELKGCTPLCFAAQLLDGLSIYLLWQQGASLKVIDDQKLSPLDHLKSSPELMALFGLLGGNISKLDSNHSSVQLIQRLTRNKSDLPETLFFDGQGFKSVVIVGVLQEFAQTEALVRVKFYEGNSWGAIIALLLAVGYSPREIQEVLDKYPMTLCFDFENIDTETAEGIFQTILQQYQIPQKNESIQKAQAVCKGKFLGPWLEERIYEKTQIKNLTFGELNQLTKKDGRFKHLRVFSRRYVINENLTEAGKLVILSSDETIYERIPENDHVVISDAIVAAVTIEGIYPPTCVRIKKQDHPIRLKSQLFTEAGPIDERELVLQTNRVIFKFIDHQPFTKKPSSLREIIKSLFCLRNQVSEKKNETKNNRLFYLDVTKETINEFELTSNQKKQLTIIGAALARSKLQHFNLPSWYSIRQLPLKIREILYSLPGHQKVILGRPAIAYPFLEIKPEIIQAIETRFQSSNQVILSGVSGIPLREIADTFADVYYRRFSHRFWIQCASDDSLTESYINLAKLLGLQQHEDFESLRSTIHQALEKLPNEYSLLLIFEEWKEHQVPTSDNVKILILAAQPYTREQSYHLQLSLEHQEKGFSLKGYPLFTEITNSKMLSAITFEQCNSPDEFFEMVSKKVREDFPTAYSFLNFSCFFVEESIDQSFIDVWSLFDPKNDRLRAQEDLSSLSIGKTTESGSFFIPPYIRQLNLKRLGQHPEEETAFFLEALKVVCERIKKLRVKDLLDRGKQIVFRQCNFLFNHAKWSINKGLNYKCEILSFLIEYRLEHDKEKQKTLELALALKALSPTSDANLLLGKCYSEIEKYQEALSLLNEALASYTKIEDFLKQLRAARLRTFCIYKLGNQVEAFELIKKVLELLLGQRVNEENLDLEEEIAHTYILIGNYLSDQGDDENALEYYQKALKAFSKKYTLSRSIEAAKNNIANCYIQFGKYQKALRVYLQIFEEMEALDPSPTNHKVTYLINTVYAHYKLVQLPQALEVLKRGERMLEKFTQPKEFLQNEFYFLHGDILLARGAKEEKDSSSRDLIEVIELLYSQGLQGEKSQIVDAHYSLAKLAVWTGMYPKAIQHIEDALQNSPKRGTKKWLMIGLKGKIKASQGYFKEGLSDCEFAIQNFPSDFVNGLEYAVILAQRGWCQLLGGNLKEADQDFEGAYNIHSKYEGNKYHETAIVNSQIGYCKALIADAENNPIEKQKAIDRCLAAVDDLRAVFTPLNCPLGHIELITAYSQLGEAYRISRQFDLAIIWQQKALDGSRELLKSADHPLIGEVLYRLGNCHRCLKQFPEAISRFGQAASISDQFLYTAHPLKGQAWYQMALSQLELNQKLSPQINATLSKAREILKLDLQNLRILNIFEKEFQDLLSLATNETTSAPSPISSRYYSSIELQYGIQLKQSHEQGFTHLVEVELPNFDAAGFKINSIDMTQQKFEHVRWSITAEDKLNPFEKLQSMLSIYPNVKIKRLGNSAAITWACPGSTSILSCIYFKKSCAEVIENGELHVEFYPYRLSQSKAWISFKESEQPNAECKLKLELAYLAPDQIIQALSETPMGLNIELIKTYKGYVASIISIKNSKLLISNTEELSRMLECSSHSSDWTRLAEEISYLYKRKNVQTSAMLWEICELFEKLPPGRQEAVAVHALDLFMQANNQDQSYLEAFLQLLLKIKIVIIDNIKNAEASPEQLFIDTTQIQQLLLFLHNRIHSGQPLPILTSSLELFVLGLEIMVLQDELIKLDDEQRSKYNLTLEILIKHAHPKVAYLSRYSIQMLKYHAHEDARSHCIILLKRLLVNFEMGINLFGKHLLTADIEEFKSYFNSRGNLDNWSILLFILRMLIKRNPFMIFSLTSICKDLNFDHPYFGIGLMCLFYELINDKNQDPHLKQEVILLVQKIKEKKDSFFKFNNQNILQKLINNRSNPPLINPAISLFTEVVNNQKFFERRLGESSLNMLKGQLESFYIDREATSIASPILEKHSLINVITSFLESEKKVLLLTGDVGVGKKTALKQIAWKLLHYWDQEEYVSVPISLDTVENPTEKMFEQALKNIDLELKSLYEKKIVWFLFDYHKAKFPVKHGKIDLKNFYDTNGCKRLRNSKFIFSCATDFCSESFFKPSDGSDFVHYHLEPMDKIRTKSFVSLFLKKANPMMAEKERLFLETVSAFNKALEEGYDKIFSNPYVLQSSIKYLRYIFRENLDDQLSIMNIHKLMQSFRTEIDQETPLTNQKELCFNVVYQACLNGKWKDLEQQKQYLYGLRNFRGLSVFEVLLNETHDGAIQKIIELHLEHFLSSGDFSLPLHQAAARGQLKLVSYFLTFIPIDQVDPVTNQTALHMAILAGQPESVALLLKHDASSRKLCRFNQFDLTAPLLAIALGEINCFDQIVEKFDWQDEAREIGSVLHVAIYFCQMPMLKHLLERYQSKIESFLNRPNSEGVSPTHLAATFGNLRALYLLFEKRADMFGLDNFKRTPLHIAAKNGFSNCVRFLACLSNDINQNDTEGKRALDLTENPKIKSILLKPKSELSLKGLSFVSPSTIILQGWGYDLLINLMEQLISKGKCKKLKRIAGDSTGALIAALYASGYSLDEMKALFNEQDILNFKFFSESNLQKAFQKACCIKELWDCMGPSLIEKDDFKSYFEHLWKATGIEDIEAVRGWIDNKIKEKTEISDCTFGEFKKLIDENPKKFKHIHIFAYRIGQNGEAVEFSSSNKQWEDLIISYAVAASLATFGLYKPVSLYFKQSSSLKRMDSSKGYFVGNPLSNKQLIEKFDRAQYVKEFETKGPRTLVYNFRTLGIYLYPPQNSFEKRLLEKIEKLFFQENSERRIYNKAYNSQRQIECESSEFSSASNGTNQKESDSIRVIDALLQQSVRPPPEINQFISNYNLVPSLVAIIHSDIFDRLDTNSKLTMLLSLSQIEKKKGDLKGSLDALLKATQISLLKIEQIADLVKEFFDLAEKLVFAKEYSLAKTAYEKYLELSQKIGNINVSEIQSKLSEIKSLIQLTVPSTDINESE